MTSAGFDAWKKGALGSGTLVDLDTDTIKVRLINVATDYPTLNLAATSMTGITGYAGTTDQTIGSAAISATVAGTTTFGTIAFNGASVTFTAVSISGSKTVAGLVVYKFVTNDAGSTPILWIDGFTAVTPNGGDITINWDSGNNKILSLT